MMELRSDDIYSPVVQGLLKMLAETAAKEPEVTEEAQRVSEAIRSQIVGCDNVAVLIGLAVLFEDMLNRSFK